MKVKLVIIIESGYDFDEDDTYILPDEKGDFEKVVNLSFIPKSGDSIVIKEVRKIEESLRISSIRHYINDLPKVFIKMSNQESLGDELHPSRPSQRCKITKLLLQNGWKKVRDRVY
jgi:hypothetical protein